MLRLAHLNKDRRKMPRQIDPLSFAQRVQRMEPGQTIHFPLSDYVRTSIHVSLSRLRSEYKDLMGGTMLPCWSLDIPTPPGDLWAVTYHGLTEGGRVARPRLSEQEAQQRRREAQSRAYYRRSAERSSRLAERVRNDPRLQLDAPLGLIPLTQDEVGPVEAPKRELSQKQLEHLNRLRARRSEKAMLRRQERERQLEERLAKQREANENKLPTLSEIEARLQKIADACEHYEQREEQVLAQLNVARDARDKARPTDRLSDSQRKRVEQGHAKSRYDRALERIEYFKRRAAHYEKTLERLDNEREALKDLRETVKARESEALAFETF